MEDPRPLFDEKWKGRIVLKERTAKEDIYAVDPRIVSICNKKSVEKFLSDVMPKVFERREMANSSVSGKPCNANIGKISKPVKPAIDQVRL